VIKVLLYAEIEPELENPSFLAILDIAAHGVASTHNLTIEGREVTNADSGTNRVVVWHAEGVK
jgi:hypothetical protein